MRILTMTLAAGLVAVATLTGLSSTKAPVGPEVEWTAPGTYVTGLPFEVSATYRWDHAEPGLLPDWWMSSAAFGVGGEPLAERTDGTFRVEPGAVLTVTFDLGPALVEAGVAGTFQLFGPKGEPREVPTLTPAPAGLSFMDAEAFPSERLADFKVLLRTNQGDMLLEFYPHLAPGHVRNYLDLAYTGFYDEVLFHRVIPSFMIQGGDPFTKDPTKKAQWGGGNGPRLLDAEFTTEKHVRGTLSAARLGHDVNSASCQFFIMHADYPALDGNYSVFGKLVSGFETLDAIATTPRGVQDRPNEEQKILAAIVLQ